MNIHAFKPSFAVRTLLLAATLACAAAPAPAMAWPFGGEKVEGNGSVTRQSRQVEHFRGISLELPAQVELRMGNTEGITIETDDNLQRLIETEVDDGVLRIRPTKRNMNLRARTMKIVVNARQIERLSLGGSGTIDAEALRAPTLRFNLGGSGKIRVASLESDRVSISVGGSGDFRANGGKTRDVSVSIGGSGNVDLGKVAADSASVSVAGSGDVTVWARNELSMSIAGSGDVNYYGDPQLRRSVAGSGEARRLGGAPN
ncbi:head GIN domain-containing protein [Telluria beijingensis]|uniref:head GIN domain-containing protein n=1 Tax=Telluria beijingensis TaxID=3068633 RepID=UPI0027962330|nr:head GIN domain-containing protein [Massilia sp. REN29]